MSHYCWHCGDACLERASYPDNMLRLQPSVITLTSKELADFTMQIDNRRRIRFLQTAPGPAPYIKYPSHGAKPRRSGSVLSRSSSHSDSCSSTGELAHGSDSIACDSNDRPCSKQGLRAGVDPKAASSLSPHVNAIRRDSILSVEIVAECKRSSVFDTVLNEDGRGLDTSLHGNSLGSATLDTGFCEQLLGTTPCVHELRCWQTEQVVDTFLLQAGFISTHWRPILQSPQTGSHEIAFRTTGLGDKDLACCMHELEWGRSDRSGRYGHGERRLTCFRWSHAGA